MTDADRALVGHVLRCVALTFATIEAGERRRDWVWPYHAQKPRPK